MTGATTDRESRRPQQPSAQPSRSGSSSAPTFSWCYVFFSLFIMFWPMFFSIKNITQCRTLLPATCEVTNITRASCSVNVTPENGDAPFSSHSSRSQSLVIGKELECFYCHSRGGIVQFDSSSRKIWWIEYLFPIVFFGLLLSYCCCCCCQCLPARGQGRSGSNPSRASKTLTDQKQDSESHNRNKKSTKESDSGSAGFNDSQDSSTTSSSEISYDLKISIDESEG